MGGSMGVTQGMLQEFGSDRVRNTPISEMAIVGAGIGAAMQGMRPIVEIMYQDFTTLAMEQIVNQAAKHRYMSGGQLSVPLTIRTQGGAGWSPGAQHAQQLEAWFVHVPGLKVAFPSTPADARDLLWSSIYDDNPVLFFEHRLLYPVKGEVPEEPEPLEFGKARVHREGDGRHRRRDRPSRPRGAQGGRRARARRDLGRGLGSAHAAATRRGVAVASVAKTHRCVVAHEAVDPHGLGRRGRRRSCRSGPSTSSTPRSERVGSKFAPASRSRRSWSSTSSRTRRTSSPPIHAHRRREDCSRGDRGHAAPARPGDGVGHDRALAEGRRRHGRAGRAALRARHREGHPGGRVAGRGRPPQDPRRRGRGDRGRKADLRDRRSRRGGHRSRRRLPRRRRQNQPSGGAETDGAEPAEADAGLEQSAEAPAPAPSQRAGARGGPRGGCREGRRRRRPRAESRDNGGAHQGLAARAQDREGARARPAPRRRDGARRPDRRRGRRARRGGARLGGEAGTGHGGQRGRAADERPPDDRAPAHRGVAGAALRDLDVGRHVACDRAARAARRADRRRERRGRPTRTS